MTDKKEPKKLTGYKHLLTLSGTFDVCGKGTKRVLVDRKTGINVHPHLLRHTFAYFAFACRQLNKIIYPLFTGYSLTCLPFLPQYLPYLFRLLT